MTCPHCGHDLEPSAPSDFDSFWKHYPRKVGKGAAERAWKKLQPSVSVIVAALAWQVKSEQWTKDNGQFIPHPATYLNQRRWEDEPPPLRLVPSPTRPPDSPLVRSAEKKIAELRRAQAAPGPTREQLEALRLMRQGGLRERQG